MSRYIAKPLKQPSPREPKITDSFTLDPERAVRESALPLPLNQARRQGFSEFCLKISNFCFFLQQHRKHQSSLFTATVKSIHRRTCDLALHAPFLAGDAGLILSRRRHKSEKKVQTHTRTQRKTAKFQLFQGKFLVSAADKQKASKARAHMLRATVPCCHSFRILAHSVTHTERSRPTSSDRFHTILLLSLPSSASIDILTVHSSASLFPLDGPTFRLASFLIPIHTTLGSGSSTPSSLFPAEHR